MTQEMTGLPSRSNVMVRGSPVIALRFLPGFLILLLTLISCIVHGLLERTQYGAHCRYFRSSHLSTKGRRSVVHGRSYIDVEFAPRAAALERCFQFFGHHHQNW